MDGGVLRRSRADAAASSAVTDAACGIAGPSSSTSTSASASASASAPTAPDGSPALRPRHHPGGSAAQRRSGGGSSKSASAASALCLVFLTVLLLGVPGPVREPAPHRFFTHEGALPDGVPLTAEDRARLASRPGNRSQRPQNDPFWQTLANVTIVYTWVNGSDPLFQGQRRSQGNRGGESRYRETGELVHSVRSLERFLPWWTGDLVLVTPNGVWPRQLSRRHPRVRVVDQYDILPKEAAPAFNSAVFEQRLHLVPGLSDVFIHMNDDYLVGRLTHPSDFFTDDGGPRLYFETSVVRGRRKQHLDLRRERRKLWLASVFNTVATATEKLGDRRTHHFVKHAPFVYSRAALLRMHELFGDELKAGLAHRFRSHDDVLTPFLHHITLMELGVEEGTAGSGGRSAWFASLPQEEQERRLNVTWASHSSSDQDAKLCYVRDDLRGTLAMMATHLRAPHMFIAVNDGFSSATSGAALRAFLQRTTPYPSAFERSAAAAAAAFGVEASYDADAGAPRWSPDAAALVRRAARVVANRGVAGVDTYTTPDPVMVADEKRRRHWMAVARATRGYTLPAALEGPGADVPAACRTAEGQAVLGSRLLCERPLVDASPTASANKTHRGIPHCEAVDAVVFVDAAAGGGGGGGGPAAALPSSLPQLLADNAALRATLRSLHRNLPWLRHVWVVAEVAPGAAVADSRGSAPPAVALTLLPAARADVRKKRLPAGSDAASVAHRYVAVSAGLVYTAPTYPHELAGSRLLGTRQPFFKSGTGAAAPAPALAPHVPVVVDRLLEEYFSGAAGPRGGAGRYAHALALHRSAAAAAAGGGGAEEAEAEVVAAAGASLELGGLVGFVAKEVEAGRASAEDVACRALGVHPARGAGGTRLQALRGCGAEEAVGASSAAAWGKECMESVAAAAATAVSRVEFGAGAAAAAAAGSTPVEVPVLELGRNATKPQLDKLFRGAVESRAGAVFVKASLGELSPDEVELLTHLQPMPAPWE